jgi:hypothetical protein
MRAVAQILFCAAQKLQQNSLFDQVMAINGRSQRRRQQVNHVATLCNLFDGLNVRFGDWATVDGFDQRNQMICNHNRAVISVVVYINQIAPKDGIGAA